jgi:hypothetical protein
MEARELTPNSLRELPARTFALPKLPVTAPLVRRSSEVLMRLFDGVVSMEQLWMGELQFLVH